MEPLYVLMRTSGRPTFFGRAFDSARSLTWPGGVTIITHTDDPRDSYVRGDIVIKAQAYGPYMGSAPYNLYCNALLAAIPGDGWVHFLDDDDEYVAPDVFERLLDGNPSKDKMHCGKVTRWNGVVFPQSRQQKGFQTEIFCTWSKVAKSAKWWSEKGGDHYYTKQLTKMHDIRFTDVMIAKAQEGKGHGKRVDIGGAEVDWDNALKPGEHVHFLCTARATRSRLQVGKLYEMPYIEARSLEKYGLGRVTFKHTMIEVRP